jgi:hypothetical protein
LIEALGRGGGRGRGSRGGRRGRRGSPRRSPPARRRRRPRGTARGSRRAGRASRGARGPSDGWPSRPTRRARRPRDSARRPARRGRCARSAPTRRGPRRRFRRGRTPRRGYRSPPRSRCRALQVPPSFRGNPWMPLPCRSGQRRIIAHARFGSTRPDRVPRVSLLGRCSYLSSWSYFRCMSFEGSRLLASEDFGVVELALVGQDVRVGVGGDGERALSHRLADARPWHAAEMQERDAPVPEVVG